MSSDEETEPQFSVGANVLVPQVDKYYEARIQACEMRDEWYYLLHYLGWNKRWDEWLSESAIIPYDEDVMQQQKSAQQDAQQTLAKVTKTSETSKQANVKSKKDSGAATQEPARPADAQVDQKKAEAPVCETARGVSLSSLPLPATLKQALLADWEIVVNKKQVYTMPRNPTIEQILAKYIQHTKLVGGNVPQEEDTVNGIRIFIDTCLPTRLLYSNEYDQFDEINEQGYVPSAIYGVEHLLRLLVQLPVLLELSGMGIGPYANLKIRVGEFSKWLATNIQRLNEQEPDAEVL